MTKTECHEHLPFSFDVFVFAVLKRQRLGSAQECGARPSRGWNTPLPLQVVTEYHLKLWHITWNTLPPKRRTPLAVLSEYQNSVSISDLQVHDILMCLRAAFKRCQGWNMSSLVGRFPPNNSLLSKSCFCGYCTLLILHKMISHSCVVPHCQLSKGFL